MKKNTLFSTLLFFCIAFSLSNASQETSLISCQNKQNSSLKALVLVEGESDTLKQVARIIAFDLGFTDQIAPDIRCTKTALKKNVLKKMFKTEDISLCVSLQEQKRKANKSSIKVQVKEAENSDVLFEKTFACSDKNIVYDSHVISSQLVPVLTGDASVAASSLTYCEQYKQGAKSICVTDYSCFTKKTLLKDSALNIAPSWHSNNKHLFYSRFTKKNSQLRCLDSETGMINTICSYDGINMQPSCSRDGTQVVLSMSGKRGNTELYLYDQRLCKAAGKRVFKQLTSNGGNNVSPCLLANGNVIFCSDFETGSPQIYHLDRNDNSVKRVTNKQGYCAGPSFHEDKNILVYSRLLEGTFQLFYIDLQEKHIKERQLTSSEGDKLDPSWSPCGRYVAFTYDYVDGVTKKRIPQIAVLNFYSGTIRILTKDATPKSFVTWNDRPHYSSKA